MCVCVYSQRLDTTRWVNGGWEPDRTYQETDMLVLSLCTMQFFSSGLIMVGYTIREALVLTMGRDLKGEHGTVNR